MGDVIIQKVENEPGLVFPLVETEKLFKII